jgi:hypothetical protein
MQSFFRHFLVIEFFNSHAGYVGYPPLRAQGNSLPPPSIFGTNI